MGTAAMGRGGEMADVNKAKEFERDFAYGKGIIPTPASWIEAFWKSHHDKVVELMRPAFRKAQTVLFIGVGSGDVIPQLEPAGKRIIGIDLNRKFLETAAAYCETIEGDGTDLPLAEGTCDLVICNMVLHHIVAQGGLDRTIAEAARVLVPGGTLLAFEPNLYHPSGMALTLLNKFRLYHAVAGGSDYEYALSPFGLARICRDHFRRVAVRAVTFGHPRFPLFLQRSLFRLDAPLAGLYPLSFSFAVEAEK